MATTSMREAVRRFDVSKPTLLKALQSGKVSGQKRDDGTWQIEASELARVYQARPSTPGKAGESQRLDITGATPPLSPEYSGPVNTLLGEAETATEDLRVKLAAAEARAEAAERVADVMGQLAAERLERIEDMRRLLLPAPGSAAGRGVAETPATAKARWWPFGRR